MPHRITLACVLLATTVGCSSARSQVSQVQAEKEQLITAIKEQKQELDALRDKNTRLAAQLTEAEIEIARGPSFDSRRFAAKSLENERSTTGTSIAEAVGATTKALAAANKPAVPAPLGTGTKPATPAPAAVVTKDNILPLPSEVNSKLAWKPERSTAGATATSASSGELKQWAGQREWLKFDEATKSVAVVLPLDFAADGTSLTTESKTKLNELAALLQSGAGKDLRVMVAGQTAQGTPPKPGDPVERYTSARHLGSARALAVADYLDRSGIASERLGISSVAADSAAAATAPRLSIHVLPGDAPVVGWTPPADTIRR